MTGTLEKTPTSTFSLLETKILDRGVRYKVSKPSGGELLVSAGAGQGDQVYITDCATGQVRAVVVVVMVTIATQVVRARRGHAGHAMCVYTWAERQVFVSGGQDGAAVFWDTRTGDSVHRVQADTGQLHGCCSCSSSTQCMPGVGHSSRERRNSKTVPGEESSSTEGVAVSPGTG